MGFNCESSIVGYLGEVKDGDELTVETVIGEQGVGSMGGARKKFMQVIKVREADFKANYVRPGAWAQGSMGEGT